MKVTMMQNVETIQDILVEKVMIREVVSLPYNALMKETQAIFNAFSFHHIIITDEMGKLYGILSREDLKLLLHWASKIGLKESNTANNKLLDSLEVKYLCETHPLSISPLQTLAHCYEIFRENKVRALPVINPDEEILGIITTFDLLKVAYSSHQS
jgi:acetoin utilization protein AcuB